MKPTTILLSCLLLASPALADRAAAQTNAATAPAVSPATQQFITRAAISDLFEIATARLALARGTEAQKAFANQMIEDHGKTSSELRQIMVVRSMNVDLPSQLDSAHQAKYDRLNDARGQDFAVLYTEQQIEAHKEAIAQFERYAQAGDIPELKEWASKTLPALKHHLEMAEALGVKNAAPTSGQSTK
jgi:putative membrane protein